MNLVSWLVIVVSLLVTIVVLLGVALWIVTLISDRIYSARQDSERLHIRAKLHMLDRWCAYDFPIIEDVCAYLVAEMNDDLTMSVSDFRDLLRKKWGATSSVQSQSL